MTVVGIICEYNPFHNGHLRQLELVRELMGADSAVVCLMSGNYVQRGEPALFHKSVRAEAALRCGADLVLELPVTTALSSAEGFAAGGVRILSDLGCDRLCFGAETEDAEALRRTAEANLDPAFDVLVRKELEGGCSYAAARQSALEQLGAGAGLSSPNDILAVEYWKAILRQNSSMRPLPVTRPGSYHAEDVDPSAPSATAVRGALLRGDCWRQAVPDQVRSLYESAVRYTWAAGERAVLARVRTLPEEAFASLPFGSEGLWSKLMKNCRVCASTQEILERTKSRRYPMTRLQRMLLCAYLGVTAREMTALPPYVRILGFSPLGRALLHGRRGELPLINAGATGPDPAYFALERRASDLFGLFAISAPEPCGREEALRVIRHPEA